MSQIGRQVAGGRPHIPTTWGVYGPGILWLSRRAPTGPITVAVGSITETAALAPVSASRTVPIGTVLETDTLVAVVVVLAVDSFWTADPVPYSPAGVAFTPAGVAYTPAKPEDPPPW